MTTAPEEHKAQAPRSIGCFVITVSDTRTRDTDQSGQLICDKLTAVGHRITGHQLVPDDPARMTPILRAQIDDPETQAILMTGGTGIGPRDQTYETVTALIDKPIPGYGELFRWLSYHEIGAAAMLSRAVGGLARGTLILVMPGSSGAVRLALEKIILPELSHLVGELSRDSRRIR